jgi:hypothetical protein
MGVCSEKMAAPGEKSFCVLEYHTSKSVVTVQRVFRANYKLGVYASRNQVVAHWPAADDEQVRASFLHSPKKSTGPAGTELSMSKTTVWRVLCKGLVFSCYKCL